MYRKFVRNVLHNATWQCPTQVLELIKDTKKRRRKQETETLQEHLTDKLLFEEQS